MYVFSICENGDNNEQFLNDNKNIRVNFKYIYQVLYLAATIEILWIQSEHLWVVPLQPSQDIY